MKTKNTNQKITLTLMELWTWDVHSCSRRYFGRPTSFYLPFIRMAELKRTGYLYVRLLLSNELSNNHYSLKTNINPLHLAEVPLVSSLKTCADERTRSHSPENVDGKFCTELRSRAFFPSVSPSVMARAATHSQT